MEISRDQLKSLLSRAAAKGLTKDQALSKIRGAGFTLRQADRPAAPQATAAAPVQVAQAAAPQEAAQPDFFDRLRSATSGAGEFLNNAGDVVGATLSQAADTITGGNRDNINAAGEELLERFGILDEATFDERKARLRADREARAERNPIATGVGTAAGIAAPVAAAVLSGGTAAPAVLPSLTKAAGGAAVAGGTFGFLEDPTTTSENTTDNINFTERLRNTFQGAALGGATLGVGNVLKRAAKPAAQVLGALKGISGDVVNEAIKAPSKFRKLAADFQFGTQQLKGTLDSLEDGFAKHKVAIGKEFDEKFAQAGVVDISTIKKSIKDLPSLIKGGTLEAKKQRENIRNITAGLIDTGTVDGLELGANGVLRPVQRATQLANKIDGAEAKALVDNTRNKIRDVLQSSEIDEGTKRAFSKLSEDVTELNTGVVGKDLAQKYKRTVVDLGKDIKDAAGDFQKNSTNKNLKKLQTSIKSAGSFDNDVGKKIFDDIKDTTGVDLNKKVTELAATDIFRAGKSRLFQRTGIKGALDIVADPAFNGVLNIASQESGRALGSQGFQRSIQIIRSLTNQED